MECPYIRVEESGATVPLLQEVTTVGRGRFVDVQLADPSVSMLHAEIVRRGPYVYVTDMGLSRNGTRVNGRLVARRLLADGDVVSFGSARCRAGGIGCEELTADTELRRPAAPELTRRELDVVTALCRPALSDEAFVAPATAREIAVDLVVTEAAVKQHLLRLYQKFRIPEGANRRVRLANEVVALGLVRPLPQSDTAERTLPASATLGQQAGAAASGAAGALPGGASGLPGAGLSAEQVAAGPAPAAADPAMSPAAVVPSQAAAVPSQPTAAQADGPARARAAWLAGAP
jgi:hypothetical protein